MDDQNESDDREDPCLLTVAEFIKLAGDRGRKLWTTERGGKLWMTDGRRFYRLPRMTGGLMPAGLVASLLVYFAMEGYAPDFALDPPPED